MTEVTSLPDDLWTVERAAQELDPPMAEAEIRAMIKLYGIRPAGSVKWTREPGRPPRVYLASHLLRAHASVVSTRLAVAG